MKRVHPFPPLIRPSPRGALRQLATDDSGVALVFIIAVFLLLFVLVLSVYSVGENIREKEELQNACDAAAHAGAVAQADTLSRMAVLNRVMSWNYVQMTKLQMDYITYNWLKVTCDKFAEDKKKCLKHTEPWKVWPDRTRGYSFVPDLLDKIYLGILKKGRIVSPYWNTRTIRIGWIKITIARNWYVFNCFHGTHNNPGNRISNYIGMRDGNHAADSGRAEEIRINGNDLDALCLRFRSGSRSGAPYGGDLDLVVDGQVARSAILSDIESLYGGYGCPDLKEQIENCQRQAAVFFTMLHGLNDEMHKDIDAAVRSALLANLPRKPGENPSEETLDDYVYFLAGGSSIAPREYETPDESDAKGASSAASYFSGLKNTEQDELLFLNMADGLPQGARVTFADYFADGDVTGIRGLGLDQWFIRCRPEESKFDGSSQGDGNVGSDCGGKTGVCVERDWVTPTYGIVRCYKNANYHDSRSKTPIMPDVHRGNYLFDFLSNAADETAGDFAKSLGSGIGGAIGSVFRSIPIIGEFIGNSVKQQVAEAVSKVVSSMFNQIGVDIISPSCHNERASFPDTCAAIPESWGLVAEYEWAAAYWLCLYERKGMAITGGIGIDVPVAVVVRNSSVPNCFHLPLPLGALCGGASENGYNPGDVFGFVNDIKQNFIGSPKGHSRGKYRSSAIFVDGEPFKRGKGCGNEILPNGMGSNSILKSYVRVYGDDKDAYEPAYYCGVRSMPWILNENFFNGGGTIVVGLAKKRRNVFAALLADDIEEKSLYAAFSPPEGSHLVALAAGRAAYAPRNGLRRAAGDDTANTSGGARYDLHYDASCKTLEPKLMRGDDPKPEWRAQAARLESDPFRIGCVCTDASGNYPSSDKMARNANRLRRQWNLCQTDWDGVLLPLRFGRSSIREYNANPTGNGRVSAADDAAPEWGPFASDYGDDDAAFSLTQILTDLDSSARGENSPVWLPLDGDGASASLPEILDSDGPNDPLEITEAIRRRRIL